MKITTDAEKINTFDHVYMPGESKSKTISAEAVKP